jgi:penicillin-binding protein 1A
MLLLAANSDLPSTEELENPRSDLATAILFSDGSQMGQYYRENRIPVDYDAHQSARGERAYRHRGRALPGSQRHRCARHVARSCLSGARRVAPARSPSSWPRCSSPSAPGKFPRPACSRNSRSGSSAARLERQYTKDEIIAMYLNRFDWINQAVGINSAARVYFNTTPDS